MSDKDVRWLQRFANYQKALIQLDNAVKLSKERELSRLEGQGLVQGFEFTHELAWNTLKDFLQYKGNNEGLYGSRDATRQAFKLGLLDDGQVWMDMIKSRNKSSHTYNEETAQEIMDLIIHSYLNQFLKLRDTLTKLKEKE